MFESEPFVARLFKERVLVPSAGGGVACVTVSPNWLIRILYDRWGVLWKRRWRRRKGSNVGRGARPRGTQRGAKDCVHSVFTESPSI